MADAAAVVQYGGGNVQTAAVDLTAVVNPGAADAVFCGAENAAAVVQAAFAVDAALAVGVKGAAVVGLAGVKTQGAAVLGGDGAAVGQSSVGAEGHAAGTGVNLAGIADAAAGIGSNQGDFAGIHAAQGAGVDGKDGGG